MTRDALFNQIVAPASNLRAVDLLGSESVTRDVAEVPAELPEKSENGFETPAELPKENGNGFGAPAELAEENENRFQAPAEDSEILTHCFDNHAVAPAIAGPWKKQFTDALEQAEP